MISDNELATRVAISGDAAAFTLLVERHQKPIRCYLRRLLVSDNATADDLAGAAEDLGLTEDDLEECRNPG